MKKFIVTASAIGALVISSTAFAENDTENKGMMMRPNFEKQFMLNITPSGEATLRGTITAIDGNILHVKSWGGDWLIRTDANTKNNSPKRIWPMMWSQTNATSTGTSTTPAPGTEVKYAVGDFIGVQGKVATDASWAINASYINNRSPMPMPRPQPLPWQTGSSTIYCIKAPCPVMKDMRGDLKDLQKDMYEKMREGMKQGGDNRQYGSVNKSGSGDAQTLDRVRAMLQSQMPYATGDQLEALKRSLTQINSISAGMNGSATVSATSSR